MILFLISGVIAAAIAGIAEILVTAAPLSFGIDLTNWEPGVSGAQMTLFLTGLLLLALTEETVKFAVLRKQLSLMPDIRPLLPSILFAIGFAAAETGLLSLLNPIRTATLLPILGIAAVHLLTSVSYGLVPKTSPKAGYLLALLIGTGAHAFYNMFLALA